jgi:MFS family permease
MTMISPDDRAAFRWYVAGMGTAFAAQGISNILFAWLVAVVLRETPARLGLAQMALMAPATLLLLLGGAVADRADGRALLIRLHAVAALPPLALAAAVATGATSYPVVLAYGIALGTLSAFMTPARDALLVRIAPGGALPRAIAMATAAQFACQLVGIAVAGAAGAVGAAAVLVAQALLLAAGALATGRLAPAPPGPRAPGSRSGSVSDGLRVVAGSPRIWPVMVAIAAVGILYVGAFIVIIPLLVRDAHHGGSGALAAMSVCFWGGTIAATLAQVRLRPVGRPGRAIAVALAFGAAVLAAMAIPGPLWLLAALCLAWGVGAGITMTQARIVVQVAAPESHRARVMSVFQLGLFGGAPLGAVALGYLAGAVGPRTAALYPAIAMLVVLAVLLARSGLWAQRAESLDPVGARPAPALGG